MCAKGVLQMMKNLLLLIIFLTTFVVLPDNAHAMNGMMGGWGPYGDYCPMQGSYGARKPVRTADEAKKILQEYFSAYKDITINNIRERGGFFEAEIKDKNNKLLDIVIVDKRTGRIRSIY